MHTFYISFGGKARSFEEGLDSLHGGVLSKDPQRVSYSLGDSVGVEDQGKPGHSLRGLYESTLVFLG